MVCFYVSLSSKWDEKGSISDADQQSRTQLEIRGPNCFVVYQRPLVVEEVMRLNNLDECSSDLFVVNLAIELRNFIYAIKP